MSVTDESLGIVFSGNTVSSTTGSSTTSSTTVSSTTLTITPSMFTSDSNSLPITIPPWSIQSVYVFT